MSTPFNCTLCGLKVKDALTWELHISGKKHRNNFHRAEEAQMKAERGVFVSGIPHQQPSYELIKLFSPFGEIEEFYHNQERDFILMRYKDKQSAQALLRSPVYLHGRKLAIRPQRTQHFNAIAPVSPREEVPTNGVDHKLVKKLLSDGAPLELLIHELELPADSASKHQQLCRDLEAVFVARFPGCMACPFGSTVTGLGLKGSDLDVFLDTYRSLTGASAPTGALSLPVVPQPEELVKFGRRILQQNKQLFTNIVAVTRAKTPIIKFVHRPTKISCDVSFKNSFGVCNSNLIRFYISLDPRIRPYLMIIKYWGKLHELSGCGRMSNYALVMKSLFYLQQLENPIIPSVAELQNSCTDDDVVDGWMCKFNSDVSCVKPTTNKDTVFMLLYGFFHYYAEFDYGGKVISPFIGTTIPKTSFVKPELLPETLHRYKQRKEEMMGLKVIPDMCIQDPFDLTHNLTGGMSSKFVTNFCAYCEIASGICENILKQADESNQVSLLINLFDVDIKPLPKRMNLTSGGMKVMIPVGQYLSLGLALSGEVEGSPSSDSIRDIMIDKWYSLVYRLLIDILQTVMKFKVHEEQNGESASKVQKVGEPSDVHDKASDIPETSNASRIIHCESYYNIWDGRKKTQKSLKLSPELYLITAEQMISDTLMETRYKKRVENPDGKPLLKLSCTFEPKQNPPHVVLSFVNVESDERAFIPVMCLLQMRLPGWMEKCMKYLSKQHYSEAQAGGVQEKEAVLNDSSSHVLDLAAMLTDTKHQ